jgi:hypothetical protein
MLLALTMAVETIIRSIKRKISSSTIPTMPAWVPLPQELEVEMEAL